MSPFVAAPPLFPSPPPSTESTDRLVEYRRWRQAGATRGPGQGCAEQVVAGAFARDHRAATTGAGGRGGSRTGSGAPAGLGSSIGGGTPVGNSGVDGRGGAGTGERGRTVIRERRQAPCRGVDAGAASRGNERLAMAKVAASDARSAACAAPCLPSRRDGHEVASAARGANCMWHEGCVAALHRAGPAPSALASSKTNRKRCP